MIQSATEMLPSLEKGGDSVAHSFNCMACLSLADALVIFFILFVYYIFFYIFFIIFYYILFFYFNFIIFIYYV